MNLSKKIGFMQGRLSPMENGMIQSFPWNNWQQEFDCANDIGISAMEWTLDQENLYKNPLMNKEGQKEIIQLCLEHKITIPSLTGDCFMQFPFWKMEGKEKAAYQNIFLDIIKNCSIIGIKMVVIPLVDNGAIENKKHEENLISYLVNHSSLIKKLGMKIIFESDFDPLKLKTFIDKLDRDNFGINYDTGNSASLGFNSIDEIKYYGDRIDNVHIKDRVFNGTTVPLGDGDTDFNSVFKSLKDIEYKGNFILQTARSDNNKQVLKKYFENVKFWLERYEFKS